MRVAPHSGWYNITIPEIDIGIAEKELLSIQDASEYFGIGTNNQAEYRALILALESAVDFGNEAVCYSDSILVVEQMNGKWRVKHLNIIPLWREAVALKESFRKISFVHVPRTDMYIERIDQLANQELDRCMHAD